MFFTPELLSRRDSGIGLLWLAATLGSKSTFKKLQKRDVMTANISQLCTLVSQPAEPLALRLSSNLMVGVARVYKVKQEIFMSDVTICFNAVKKVVEEFRSRGELEMVQPTARPSTVTLANDLKTAFALEFDNMIEWDKYLDVEEEKGSKNIDNDEDFDPNAKSKRARQKKRQLSVTVPEDARADLCTLKENHEHFFSSSFEASFNGSGGGLDVSSSQHDDVFGFGGDDFLGVLDDFDIGVDLARELGPGWGGTPLKLMQESIMNLGEPLEMEQGDIGMDVDANIDFGIDVEGGVPVFSNSLDDIPMAAHTEEHHTGSRTQSPELNQEKFHPPPLGSPHTLRSVLSPASFARSFLNQDTDQGPEVVEPEPEIKRSLTRKSKTTRLLLDARTELTDEELKAREEYLPILVSLDERLMQAARAQYLEEQSRLRRELGLKKLEKNNDKIMDDLVWGIPSGIHAQVLVDFWLDNFKVQVEARSGALKIHVCDSDTNQDEPPAKRRKVEINKHYRQTKDVEAVEPALDGDSQGIAVEFGAGQDLGDDFFDGGYNDVDQDLGHLRSSEEPGQGRRVSRPPSVLGSNFGSNIGRQDVPSGSQQSSLFPWDNAGASSSAGGAAPGPDRAGSSRMSVERLEIKSRGRGNSLSMREGSLDPSQAGSATGVGFSPMVFRRMNEDDFAFEIPVDGPPVTGDSQQSDLNLVTLERNSLNFLEYAKMQLQSLPPTAPALSFDDIVPKMTSTRRVAAAAFYHCLVLATKNLIRLDQPTAYGEFSIVVV